MKDGNALAETLFQPRGEDRRERNLRHQQQRLLPAPDRLPHQLDVDLGFSASGDAFEQEGSEGAERTAHRLDGLLLLKRVMDLPHRRGIQIGEKGIQGVTARSSLDAHHPFLHQLAENGGADAGALERGNRHLAAA